MPKPTTTRVAELRKRRAALGLKRLEVYAHPDDHRAIKAYAAELLSKRSIVTTVANPPSLAYDSQHGR